MIEYNTESFLHVGINIFPKFLFGKYLFKISNRQTLHIFTNMQDYLIAEHVVLSQLINKYFFQNQMDVDLLQIFSYAITSNKE